LEGSRIDDWDGEWCMTACWQPADSCVGAGIKQTKIKKKLQMIKEKKM